MGGYLLIQLKVYSCGNDEELDKMVNKDVIKKMDNEMDDGFDTYLYFIFVFLYFYLC